MRIHRWIVALTALTVTALTVKALASPSGEARGEKPVGPLPDAPAADRQDAVAARIERESADRSHPEGWVAAVAASAAAEALPMPLLAPVIKTVLPCMLLPLISCF